MSYTSIYAATTDPALNSRVIAAAEKEAHNNPALADTDFGRALVNNTAQPQVFMWPVAIATEAAYESALAANNPNPGGDPAVITDGDILASVQANWPPDPWPPAPTTP
jgi:hypothetical protein